MRGIVKNTSNNHCFYYLEKYAKANCILKTAQHHTIAGNNVVNSILIFSGWG